jgi:hypothetical protein
MVFPKSFLFVRARRGFGLRSPSGAIRAVVRVIRISAVRGPGAAVPELFGERLVARIAHFIDKS